jgi:hypothetical protein
MIHELIGIGFWRNLADPAFPDPAWFVDSHWAEATRRAVLAYLEQGQPMGSQMGFSWCRFRCGVPDHCLGSTELTDGTYGWPSGLVHYVRDHQLRLPDEVVLHMLGQAQFPPLQAALVSEASRMNTSWWATQRGWHQTTSSYLCRTEQEARDYLRRWDRGAIHFQNTSPAARAVRQQMVQALRESTFASSLHLRQDVKP